MGHCKYVLFHNRISLLALALSWVVMKYYGLSSAYSRWGWIRLWPGPSFPPPSRWWTGGVDPHGCKCHDRKVHREQASDGEVVVSPPWDEAALPISGTGSPWCFGLDLYLQGKKEAQYSLDKQILYPKGCYIVSSSSLWVSWDWSDSWLF